MPNNVVCFGPGGGAFSFFAFFTAGPQSCTTEKTTTLTLRHSARLDIIHALKKRRALDRIEGLGHSGLGERVRGLRLFREWILG